MLMGTIAYSYVHASLDRAKGTYIEYLIDIEYLQENKRGSRAEHPDVFSKPIVGLGCFELVRHHLDVCATRRLTDKIANTGRVA